MLSISDNNWAGIDIAFNSTSSYLGDFLNIDDPYFEHLVCQLLNFS